MERDILKEMKYNKVMMKTAYNFAELSYCGKRQVGAVLVKDNRILATGYNGTISGKPNKCEGKFIICECGRELDPEESIFNKSSSDGIYRICRCNCGKEHNVKIDEIIDMKYKTSEFVLHAEQNVISFCSKNGIPTNKTTLYVTTAPCKQCAKLIAQSGISKVIYKEDYKNNGGIYYLESCGVEVKKLEG